MTKPQAIQYQDFQAWHEGRALELGLPEDAGRATTWQHHRTRELLYSNMDGWPPGEEPLTCWDQQWPEEAPLWHPGKPIRPENAWADPPCDAGPEWGARQLAMAVAIRGSEVEG